jgi:hypothetical protein
VREGGKKKFQKKKKRFENNNWFLWACWKLLMSGNHQMSLDLLDDLLKSNDDHHKAEESG